MTDLARIAESDYQGIQTRYLHMWCPGCDDLHQIVYERTDRPGDVWQWGGSLDAPTISPSLLVHGHQWAEGESFHKPNHQVAPGEATTCHSFIKAGQWQFLTDSTHNLAGRTVPMVPVDQWPY
ncbi:hypothetical protein ATK74_1742 [Propionicimonas paludicola]|uniref:Ammonia monooxygenase n=1 Tax=Propionicimonas paludicola TaxID=185243 RepID=A0A2A9CUE4_9ACTN|nr:DUF6527 family protein [Propionicimonas paludicola]PFG17179.1 hypothetical protein ATK74_1742 [Propionicimonas paludicola]